MEDVVYIRLRTVSTECVSNSLFANQPGIGIQHYIISLRVSYLEFAALPKLHLVSEISRMVILVPIVVPRVSDLTQGTTDNYATFNIL